MQCNVKNENVKIISSQELKPLHLATKFFGRIGVQTQLAPFSSTETKN